MKYDYLKKTHYELFMEYFDNGKYLDSLSFESFLNIHDCGSDPTYQEFCSTSPLLKQFSSMNVSKAALLSTASIFYHVYCLYKSKEKFYYICPQLARNLLNTELNIDSYFLKSPFPELYIQIEPGTLQIYELMTKELWPVTGIYVHYAELKDGDKFYKQLRIMAIGLKPENSKSEVPTDGLDDSAFYFKIDLKDGKIQDLLQENIDGILNNQTDLETFGGYANVEHIRQIFNFVLNVLLYITSKDPDIIKQLPYGFIEQQQRLKNPAKLRKLQSKISKYTSKEILIVGQKVISPYKNIEKSENSHNWKLEKRVYVSGHWKIQWYGSEKDNSKHHKVIYIEPYEKGPELAEVIKKKYVVG